MIAFHKRNFPLHHCMQCMAPAEIFVGRGGKPKPPPPPCTCRKVAKNWQKGRHMNKKAPIRKKTLIFSKGGGLGPTLPPCWRPCLYYLNNPIHFLKRTFSENIFEGAPNCTINQHSGVCSNTLKCSAQ